MSLDNEDTQMSITTQPDMDEVCERGGGGQTTDSDTEGSSWCDPRY